MDIKVDKIDDINYIVSGSINNSVIEEKIQSLTNDAKKESKDEEVSEEQISQVAAEQVFREFIDAAIEKAGISVDELLGQPGLKKYEKQEENVIFEVELATSPEVNFDGVSFDDIVPSYEKPKAEPKVVQQKFNEFAEQQAKYEPIAEPKAVEDGDMTIIDFTGYVDGEAFKGGHAERFNLQIGSKSFIKGFEDQMIGMEYGEQRDVIVTFPENYTEASLAGKEAKFVVKLHEIQEKKAQEIDDEMAQKILGVPTATVATLLSKFEEQVISEKLSNIYVTDLKPVMVEGLLKKFDFTLPNNIVEQEISAKTHEQIAHLSAEEQSKILQDKEKLLSIRESVIDEAKATIKKAIIIDALAKKENIVTNEQEAVSALTYQAMMTGQNAQELVNHYKNNNLLGTVVLAINEDKLFGKMLGFDKQ